MTTDQVFDDSGTSFIRAFSMDTVEKVNPVEFFKNSEIEKRATIYRDLLNSKNPFITSILGKDFFIKQAEKSLIGFFEKFQQTPINDNLEKVLTTKKKKDQISLLKGIAINTDELAALIFRAYTDYGYFFSRYVFENLPNGVDEKKITKIILLKR